jgi:hypothetical protein
VAGTAAGGISGGGDGGGGGGGGRLMARSCMYMCADGPERAGEERGGADGRCWMDGWEIIQTGVVCSEGFQDGDGNGRLWWVGLDGMDRRECALVELETEMLARSVFG